MMVPDDLTTERSADDGKDVPTNIAFVRGNDRLARMLAKPGMREAVAARRSKMRDADRSTR